MNARLAAFSTSDRLIVIRAPYSPDRPELQDVTRQNGADHWLVRRASFSDQYARSTWINDCQSEASAAREPLRAGQVGDGAQQTLDVAGLVPPRSEVPA